MLSRSTALPACLICPAHRNATIGPLSGAAAPVRWAYERLT